jgi:hypothetical protein
VAGDAIFNYTIRFGKRGGVTIQQQGLFGTKSSKQDRGIMEETTDT